MSETKSPSPFSEELRKLFENSQLTQDEDPRVWIKPIRDKLFSMLCSPMKTDFSNEAFKWIAHLCLSIGDLSWLSVEEEAWTKNEAKIFTCLAQLSMNEIHILIPLIKRHLTCGDDPEVEDGKVVDRSATSSDYDMFGNHLVILESVIKTLIVDQDTDDELDVTPLSDVIENSALSNLLDCLKRSMQEICNYLELVHRYWQELISDVDSEKFTSAIAALRIMCVWLSEEPNGFTSHCEKFIIDLITRSLLLKDGPSNHDFSILALHSLCIQNDELMKVLRENPSQKQALEIYLEDIEYERYRLKKGDKKTKVKKAFRLKYGLVEDLQASMNK